MTAVIAHETRKARIVLEPRISVIEAITRAMVSLGWPSATLQILGGKMATATYHCSILTPKGPRWIDYGPARDVSPAWLLMGCATYGRTLDDQPALHCHAVLSAHGGHTVGGHLSPERSVIGEAGLIAHAISATTACFRVKRDPATGFDLLTPS